MGAWWRWSGGFGLICLGSCIGPDPGDTSANDDTDTDVGPTCTPIDLSASTARVDLNPTPEFDGDAPIYVFNTRHTEDPFNLKYVAEIYNAVIPMLLSIQTEYPDTYPVWTLQFQGADANALNESPSLFIQQSIQRVRNAADSGLVRFGYHGQHEPTYLNRATNSLDANSTWEEVVEAVQTYITCKKSESFTGDCDAEQGGGIEAVNTHFGPVEIVSGLSTPATAAQFETPGGHHAVRSLLPDRLLGLGFSDHPPVGDSPQADIDALMERMTIGGTADGAMLWWDNSLRIHATDSVNLASGSLKYRENPTDFQTKWTAWDRDRPHVALAHLAGKYVYVKEGKSPTQYGYAQVADGASPNLPNTGDESQVLSLSDREAQLDNIATNLDYMAKQLERVNGSRFVDAAEVLKRVAPDDYWEVSEDEATAMARWVLQEWGNGAPPDFVTDGVEYYSLRDAVGVLLGRVSRADGDPGLLRLYGPLLTEDSDLSGCLPLSELGNLAESVWEPVIAGQDAAWSTSPDTILPGTFRTSIGTINLAQLLRALAVAHIGEVDGLAGDGVQIEPSAGVPTTADLATALGSNNGTDTSWSLKPARVRAN